MKRYAEHEKIIPAQTTSGDLQLEDMLQGYVAR